MTHSIYWPGTQVVRSTNNGFTGGLTGEPVNWGMLTRSAVLSKASTANVHLSRQNGTDRSTFSGMSKKADAQIAQRGAPHGGVYAKAVNAKVPSKAAQLREALRAGPMGSGDLARATGVDAHIIPALLQFDIVDRLIERYSNKGEVIYDPFCGLGTVPVRAIKAGRRGAGSELNGAYFLDQVHYLRAAERDASMPSLFDFEALQTEPEAA